MVLVHTAKERGDLYDVDTVKIPQRLWQENAGKKFQLFPAWYESIIGKLCCGKPLGQIAAVYQGEVNLTIHKCDLVNEPEVETHPLVRGRHVVPFGLRPVQTGDRLSFIRLSRSVREHARMKRLVLQQVSNLGQFLRLKCGFLQPQQPVYCANSTNYILLPTEDTTMYYYLMALCHSTVWNLLFSWGSSTNHITVRELEGLPVPDCSPETCRYLEALVRRIEGKQNAKEIGKLWQEVDQTIFQLFGFSEDEMHQIYFYCENSGKSIAFFGDKLV
jgi:hypothetical protein